MGTENRVVAKLMSLSSTSKPDSPQMLESIALPRSGQAVPGPLHTIVRDLEGNLYYSDEINHSVISLDADGCVRWQRTKHGSAPAEFSYPRGLSLGWIEKGEESVHCVAVCDAWNRRVQFLDVQGHPVETWTKGGESPFAEVADVRFIPGDFNPQRAAKPTSYWLVLDRGNHRLCAIGKNGRLLFQIGRCFPPAMEIRWAIPGMLLEREQEPPGYVRDFPPFDFTFYPERILGNFENALYLWEPCSRRLKQVLFANLLPMWIDPRSAMEWIAADTTGLLGWHRPTKRLIRYNFHGELCDQIEIHGVPISSDLPLNEFWVQNQERIERWRWNEPKHEPSESRLIKICTPLIRSARQELARVDSGRVRRAVAECTSVVDGELAAADEVIAADGGHSNQEQLDGATARLRSVQERHGKAEQDLHEALHHWCLGTMELRLAGIDAGEPARLIAHARDQWDALAGPIRDRFAEIQNRLDALLMRRLLLSRAAAQDPGAIQAWKQAALQLEAGLQKVLEWVYRWSGVAEPPTERLPLTWVLPLPEVLRNRARAAGHAAFRRTYHSPTPPPSSLRELERIPLADSRDSTPARPYSLARSPQGELFVSLLEGHQALRLDPDGKIMQRIGRPGKAAGEFQRPTGLALDSEGRLWVSDSDNHRIQVLDLMHDSVEIIGSYGSQPGQFIAPLGIGARPDGSMLVADTGNCRLVRVAPNGTCDIFSDKIGREIGEVLHPTHFGAGGHGGLWLVDRHNHRIQKLDHEERWTQSIGKCGLFQGCLFLPESVAEFEDGTIAVAQNQWSRGIKLFAPNGVELDRMVLAYYAAGMLVHHKRLFVAATYDDSIRVYERVAG